MQSSKEEIKQNSHNTNKKLFIPPLIPLPLILLLNSIPILMELALSFLSNVHLNPSACLFTDVWM